MSDGLSRLRVAVGFLGLVAVGVGGGFLATPTAASDLGVSAMLTQVGNAYLVVAATGGLLFGYVLWVTTGAMTGATLPELPAVESRTASPVPGSEVDRMMTRAIDDFDGPSRPVAHEDNLRERLQADAVATLVLRRGSSPTEATEAVKDGTWTDDRFAAAYLGGSDAPRPRLHQRLVARFVGPALDERRIRRTIEAIDTLADDGGHDE